MHRDRRARWLIGITVAAVVAMGIPVAALALSSQTSEAPTFAVMNGTVGATAVHLIAGTSAFPNFVNGAIDSRFPLANSHVDNSPASEGVASPADTGPLGQTIATLPASPPAGLPIPPGPTISQPQYSDVKYPPGATTPVVFGQPSGPYAAATATLNDATAQARVASSTGTGVSTAASPSGRSWARVLSARDRALRVALTAWRARWLSAEGFQRFPMPRAVTTATPQDGVNGDTANSHAFFDAKAGVLNLDSEAFASEASLGGGLIQLRGIHVKLNLADDGTRTTDSHIVQVAGAQVAGIPVQIDQNGVVIGNTAVPTVLGAIQAANAALNQALAMTGIKLFTLAPVITKQGNQETLDVTGVHVQFVQPATPSVPVLGGVPQQNFDQIIGEAFATSLAVPGTPISSVGTGLGGLGLEGESTGAGGSGGTFIPGTPGTPGTPGSPALAGATPPRTATLSPVRHISHTKPTYLLLLYFLWQTTLLGAAASLWWWRLAGSSP